MHVTTINEEGVHEVEKEHLKGGNELERWCNYNLKNKKFKKQNKLK